jgi:Flp pilus assembly protein TadB
MTDQKDRANRRPRWSLKTSFQAMLGILLVVTPLIIIIVEKSIWVKLELITAVVTVFIFGYLCLILYYGVRFDKRERYQFPGVAEKSAEWLESGADAVPGGGFIEAGAAEGLGGLLVGILLEILATLIVTVLLVLILWIGMNLIVGAIALVGIPLFFLFRRSLRYVVGRGRRCHGDLGKSLAYAFYYTIVNALWFYLILFSAHYLAALKI